MRKVSFLSILMFLLAFLVVSCDKKSSEPKSKVDENGLPPAVNEFVPDTLLDIIESLGMPVFRGGNPPNIQGTYLSSPFKLLNSNRPGDNIGSIYADYYVKFSGQNNTNLTVLVDYVNASENGSGLGGFIAGTDNNFSVFAELMVVVGSDTAYILVLYSGTITDGGIDNFYLALFMLDNLGNPSGYFINDGDGRVFQDSDGFSEEVPGLPKRVADLTGLLGITASPVKK